MREGFQTILDKNYNFKIADRNKHEDHTVMNIAYFDSITIVVALLTHQNFIINC